MEEGHATQHNFPRLFEGHLKKWNAHIGEHSVFLKHHPFYTHQVSQENL